MRAKCGDARIAIGPCGVTTALAPLVLVRVGWTDPPTAIRLGNLVTERVFADGIGEGQTCSTREAPRTGLAHAAQKSAVAAAADAVGFIARFGATRAGAATAITAARVTREVVLADLFVGIASAEQQEQEQGRADHGVHIS